MERNRERWKGRERVGKKDRGLGDWRGRKAKREGRKSE